VKWIHISDLHYDPESSNFDTAQLLSGLNSYIIDNGITVDAVFYTGDFRFAKTQDATLENAKSAADKLRKIASNAGISSSGGIHIVPGNHDLERGDVSLLYEVYGQYSNGEFSGSISYDSRQICCADYLSNRFEFFSWIAKELDNKIWTNPPMNIHPPYHRLGEFGGCNIVYLNTALGCGRKNERGGLRAGYEYIHKTLSAIKNQLPTIVLGHHGLNCFLREESDNIKKIFREKNVLLYLCGDEHVGGIDDFAGILQLTAGCLKNTKGVEPTFYIGEMGKSGPVAITAFRYHSGVHSGWTKYDPMCSEIKTWISKVSPPASNSVFGRSEVIKDIMDFLKLSNTNHGKIAEISGTAGVGKTTVCNEVLKNMPTAHISVNTRLYSTAIEIQSDILRQLGIDANKLNIAPADYAAILLREAKLARKILYLDNMETPIVKDRDSLTDWLLGFARQSGWRILYSTQLVLDAGSIIEPFPLTPLLANDAIDMFVSRRKTKSHKNLSDKDKQLVRDVAVTLLSCHPLAIVLATSSRQNSRPLNEIKNALQNRISFESRDDRDNPHRSMSEALSLAVAGIESSSVAAQAKLLWAQYSRNTRVSFLMRFSRLPSATALNIAIPGLSCANSA